MYTRDTDLPWAHLSGAPCPAGKAQRRREIPHPFSTQLGNWGLSRRPDPAEKRLWKVTTRSKGEGKQERTLPSGRRILYYDDDLEFSFRKATGQRFGPFFWLTYEDAEALWCDVGAAIVPACEQFTVV